MNKTTVTLLSILGVFFVSMLWGVSVNNRFVSQEEAVNGAWSQVQNVYQRRLDLIPNLVETVKGYAHHESETLKVVTEARARVGQISAQSLAEVGQDPEKLKAFQRAQDGLSSALSRLMVVAEKYPDLKANQNFLELQSQLEGTENRIAVERGRFNQIAQAYNTSLRMFPGSIIAGMRNFKPRAYFEATQGADKAPQVKF